MEYFRCNIIRLITAVIMLVVSVLGGISAHAVDAQTSRVTNVETAESICNYECADTESEYQTDCCMRRENRYLNKIKPSYFAKFNLSHSTISTTNHVDIRTMCYTRTPKQLSTLFCTLRI